MREASRRQATRLPEHVAAPRTGMARPFGASLAIHVTLLALMLVSLRFSGTVQAPPRLPGNVIEARAVDGRELRRREEAKRAEAERIAAAKEKARRDAERRRREAEEAKQRAEAERRAAEETARKAEVKRRAEAEAKRKAEAERKAAEAAERKAEVERRAAEAKQRADAEARAKAEQEARERELREALAAEEAALAAAEQEARDADALQLAMARIAAKLENAFTYPPELRRGLSCIIDVTMQPGGDVAEVRIVRSSGSAVFDRQAELAVRKASPLPVPDDPRLFRRMRQFRFTFEPSG